MASKSVHRPSVSFPSDPATTFVSPMEASEKPQLPLDVPDGGVVRALDDRLVIERLTVADERAARVVRTRAKAGQPPADTIGKAIEIGARVLDSEETAVNVDYVRREVETSLGQLDKQLGGTIEQGAEAIAEQLAANFGIERSDSVQAQIKEIVAADRESLLSALTKEDPSNPLVAMQVRIGKAMLEAEERHRQEMAKTNEQIGGLREELARQNQQALADERVAEAEAAGTRKGRTFEEHVHEAIERIAALRGDSATHTGGEQAEGGGKKGDTLVELGACDGPSQGRVLFESKDAERLSKNKAWSYLNEGMAKRAATFGVLVVAGEENVPAGRQQLSEYEGNKMIVAVDRDEPDGLTLEVAYRLAAARVLLAREADLEVDAVAVRDAAAEAVTILKQAQAIRSSLTGIKTSSDRARDGLNAMVDGLAEKLSLIDSLIAEAAKAEAD
jgi:hypothetical protein